ncbi:MAG: hypothetical protein LUQ36_07090 [Methanoregula sp.]|jgi:hypothetical protein|nr:hypothetical protein [Methanoregula sp.]
MAVHQSQVDNDITSSPEDDLEVKLQNLEREVDLIKTSIKRLLIDIRERMNDLENPFTLVTDGATAEPSGAARESEPAKKPAPEVTSNTREEKLNRSRVMVESVKKEALQSEPWVSPVHEGRKLSDEPVSAAMRYRAELPQKAISVPRSFPELPEGKLHLQKVYKLFKWTRQAVKKVGHDRLEIILESYRAMGFITKESCNEISEISRLMPASLGEEHEVGPDEFVAELYALNRILAPDDTSLDRDMIEVLMEQRQDVHDVRERSSGESPDLPRVSIGGKKSSLQKEKDDEWMHLPDRI